MPVYECDDGRGQVRLVSAKSRAQARAFILKSVRNTLSIELPDAARVHQLALNDVSLEVATPVEELDSNDLKELL